MITENISKAIEALRSNDVVAIPTETVYGLAGNAFSDVALKKIFTLKNRPFFNPLIIHIKSIDQLKDVAKEIPPKAIKLAEKFWPGPLTLVLKKQSHVPDLVTAGKDTVAIRIPDHPVALELLSNIKFPLAAPSANPFGSISPTSAKHVFNYFGEKLEVILDGGECKKGIESTIVGFENNEPVLYRLGSIAVEDLEHEIGYVRLLQHGDKQIKAPGMLDKHYSPLTTSYLTDNPAEMIEKFKDQKVGLLLFENRIQASHIPFQEILSTTGDMEEAAKNLYAALHRLDNSHLDVIIMEKLPNMGLGKSINDRLQRAAKKE
jgi:L-threonylcarbamoyladenylate synthase